MNFKSYQHIERFGTTEVENIELGTVYVFPKIDGTLGEVWKEDEIIKAGSRRRELTLEEDNQGFYDYILQNANIPLFFIEHPTHRLFGEWLVPHSLKTYREDAWRKFYIFDVCVDNNEGRMNYLPYPDYQPLLEAYGLDYISPITIIKNGSYEQFIQQLDKNVFLIEDGKGVGEGIVLKNYDFYNKYGRQTWAKIVRSEFKEMHSKVMGAPEMDGKKMVEEEAVQALCTEAFIDKTYQKIVNDCDGWSSKYIPRLLETVFYEFVTEETWQILKKYKNPTINFKTLRHFVQARIKSVKKELF